MTSSPGSNGGPSNRYHGNGYSADVRLWLILQDGTRLRPGQVGHDCVIFSEPTLIPAGPAVVEIVVDGRPHRWDVTLVPHPHADTCVPIIERNGRH